MVLSLDMKSLPLKLEYLIRQKGISKKEFGVLIERSPQQVSAYLSIHKPTTPPWDVLQKMAEVLDTTVENLMKEESEKK